MPTLLSESTFPNSFSARLQRKSVSAATNHITSRHTAIQQESATQSPYCSPPTKKTFSLSFKQGFLSLILLLGLFHPTTLQYAFDQHPLLTGFNKNDGLGVRTDAYIGTHGVNFLHNSTAAANCSVAPVFPASHEMKLGVKVGKGVEKESSKEVGSLQ